ncbi:MULTISPECIES: LacI family DNA-binding transcriptional regulator [unclassified Nocardioides]|uniref:LacI family DNA-binding transcriptional regulator n=1 Tax=unclassified Nocardioides TaxID=2615069 RepID=UPI0009F1035A|nr:MULTISPECIES: LacI family DNA-binding transcriptional regulator [unclassified Nocardioides]GAW50703.1 LacI family transcriptional regulator [Nocardioides sp. PD653-B2]GAW55442.1 LacI family transcriptional regulator [Nocardioides sp. PD653]
MTGIKDVAREVEMSTATVSRALRNLPGVSEETRARVRETARRLGYVPSPSAAGLATGQTRTVAVVVPFVTQWFFAAVVQGAEEVLRERGYDLLLYNLAGDASARHRVFETNLLTKRVDAVLVLSLKPSPDELSRLVRLDRPVTIVGADLPGWATVRIDDELAARTAMRHLLDLGHRRIGYVGGTTEGVLDFTAPTARLAGYRGSLTAAGVDREPALEVDGGFTMTGGMRAARELLDRPDRPTAVFAASDEMAIGMLRVARELGLRVPEDLSVIGIDDHEMADFFDLTTVAQPVHEQGRVAAQQVLAAMRNDDWEPQQVVLPTELVVRRTTAAPASGGGTPGR